MSLKHSSLTLALICGVATSTACGNQMPSLDGLDSYSEQTMANGRTQYYGQSQYTFTSSCGDGTTVIRRSSLADAVWFDYEVVLPGSTDTVTIEPDEDGPWSAKVEVLCRYYDDISKSKFMNFCFMGPCSNEDKP